ncbi:MAG: hypothetical protein NT001_02100, partial [Candidatus Woesearchaeota archaeon]|nr:hypothetical protein [Candidatus Woesearchaeota archaeon]
YTVADVGCDKGGIYAVLAPENPCSSGNITCYGIKDADHLDSLVKDSAAIGLHVEFPVDEIARRCEERKGFLADLRQSPAITCFDIINMYLDIRSQEAQENKSQSRLNELNGPQHDKQVKQCMK